MAQLSCPICSSKLQMVYLEAPALDVLKSRDYSYFRCAGCDVLVIDAGNGSESELDNYSNSGYYSRRNNKVKKIINWIAYFFSYQRLKIVKRSLVSSSLKGIRILDIGCGKGGFLSVAKDEGASIEGLEPIDRSYEVAHNKLGKCILNVPMSTSHYSKNSIDVVTMWHVFEHVSNPLQILSDCQYVLKKNGTLIVAVPNYRGLVARIGGRLWFNLDPPRHVIHYSESALINIVEKAGFKILDINHRYPELTYFSALQTFLNLFPITKNFLFNYLKQNNAAIPEEKMRFYKDMLLTGIISMLFLPVVFIFTMAASFFKSSDCITLIARKI